MERHIPSVRRHAGLVQRALQRRLIAQQQIERLRFFHRDFDARRGVQGSVDFDLHMTEFWRVKPHRQSLGTVYCVPELHECRSELGSWEVMVSRPRGRGRWVRGERFGIAFEWSNSCCCEEGIHNRRGG